MSHNKITVDNLSPDNAGDVPVNLSSYITESSPSTNQVVKYDGAAWINAADPAGTGFKAKASVFINETASFAGSGSYTIGNYLMIQKAGGRTYKIIDTDVTLNDATSTNTIKNNSNWLESIDIPAGTFLCICTLAIEGGSADMKARWESDAGGFSHYVHVYGNNNTRSGSLIVGVLTTATTNTIRIVVKDQSTASTLIDSGPHAALSVHVIKLA